jgi:hypothetical protein
MTRGREGGEGTMTTIVGGSSCCHHCHQVEDKDLGEWWQEDNKLSILHLCVVVVIESDPGCQEARLDGIGTGAEA